MKQRKLTYKKAGVDVKKADVLVKKIKRIVESANRSEVIKGPGGFGGLFSLDSAKYDKPVLVSSSDGVGTKLKIATLTNCHNTVGIDLVAMNVNDILCCGAQPLFFLDYISCSTLNAKWYLDVIKGISKGCKEAGCALIGGETAEMPGMYKKDEYDLAGFCVGAVDKNKILDGKDIKVGDVVIGLESNGLHSNGFSLVRRALSRKELISNAKELLRPTRIYVKPILEVLRRQTSNEQKLIKALAHVTGGAFYNKIKRIIPKGMDIVIEKNSWRVPTVFKLIQNRGNIEDKEMFSTFNMGIGMVCVVDKDLIDSLLVIFNKFKLSAWVIGRVENGNRKVKIK